MKHSARAASNDASRSARAPYRVASTALKDGTPASAEAKWRAVLQRNPGHLAALRALSDLTQQSGRHQEAAELLRSFAATPPELSNLGVSLEALGRSDEAEVAYRKAIAIDPALASTHFNLGNLLLRQARYDEAEAAFRHALTLRSDYAKAWNGLGLSRQHKGRLEAALEAFRRSIACEPASALGHSNAATILFALGRQSEALAEFGIALELNPGHALAHGNLAALLVRTGSPIAAETASRTAISLAPEEPRWLTNLGVALFAQGRHGEAEEAYRKALAIRPDYAEGHGNLLFALNYRTDLSAEAIFAEYRAWDAQHAKHLASDSGSFGLDRTPGRRLRVGYVSADFRQHAVAMFAEPLLAAHDRSHLELFLYAGVAAEDAATERFRSLSDHWRGTLGLSDDRLAELIRSDRIDVLVDLAGHSAGNRLLTFARRPAPVQVAYLLGHGYSTGLSAMDAFLADDSLAPEGADALFSERLIRLPRIPITYAPPDGMPAVALLPARANGYVTFGHFGRTERLNDEVLAAWARILHAVPRSRLILNNRPFLEPEFRSRFLARLTRHRIDPATVDLIYTEPQPNTWASYGRVDIALDPFPHNAGTTTIEALWQGVPVVSLAGRPTVGRFGASILHAVGLDAWVVDDIDGYVAHAVAAAADLDTLAALRTGSRQRVAASPLCDASGLARQIEAAYRMLWDEWRTPDEARLRRIYAEGELPAAAALAQRLLPQDATSAVANHVLGLLAYREGRLGDADAHLHAAVARDPGTAELHANHAAILRKLGRLAEAETAARAALQLDPGCVGAHNNLGNLLRDAGRFDESAACFRAAIRLAPGFADAWVNLAWVLALAGHAQQAEEASRQAIACEPKSADAHNNLGLALMRQGRLVEAEAALRDALALRPDFALPHSNILFCLNYRPDASAEEIFGEYRRWDHVHARPLLTAQPNFDLDRSPERRLRIGYVSPDFRQHAVALFAEPLLAAHDRSVVEVHCYADVPAPDPVTERFRELADHWHSTVGLSDAELAEQIRADRIDVLIDLAGHTAGNRLLAFARRPAPIQVEWLLGHGYSSGLSAMDAFLADAALAPPGAERLFSERLVRLSRIPLAYAPPAEMPDVAPLPASVNGHITFGYFGRTVRLNDNVLAIWTRILRAVPGSRLMLNSAPFGEPAGRRQMFARFAALGIQPERLDLVHTSPQPHTWAAYGQIDIALDPFPHNAGTTTIEALWQGVPVLSLAGRPTVGRFGASILHAVGLDDWITGDVEGYVQRAVTAAADIAALTRLRAGLRARFAASPLCDAAGLAREFEAAYRTLWRQWSGDGTHLRRLHAAREDRAEAALRQALALDPLDASAHFTLGALLGKSARPVEAEAHHRAALAGPSDRHRVLSNLSTVLQTQGRHAEAAQCCRDALAAPPDYAVAHSNLLSSLDHRVDLSAEAIFAEYRNWDRQHAASLPSPEVRPVVHWSAERRLRVGYVSADFCQHAAASFAEPLLAAHDRQRIELFCYAAVARPDAVTERFRTIAEHWRDIVALDDAAAAELIRRDAIDVLVDLTGHTAGSRLLIFARRPAPVQVEYLLGHGYTSGLSAMDAFIADATLAPPAADALFSERLVRLPRVPLAYAPPCAMPDVTPLPAARNGFVTFGYFGRCERLNDAVIGTWSRILRELPRARLVMNSAPFREPAFRDLIASRFVVHGVDCSRLDLIAARPRSATWAAYGGIDIALDPFPHNAGTTTIEALWQGVPVVSLAGRPSVGRFGAMILHAVAMDDWVTADVDAYVARALAVATDPERLARLRASLRQRVAGSPLCDTAGLARHVEDAFRALCEAC